MRALGFFAVGVLLVACSSRPGVVESTSAEGAEVREPITPEALTTTLPEKTTRKSLEPRTALVGGASGASFGLVENRFLPGDDNTECDPLKIFEGRHRYDKAGAEMPIYARRALFHTVYDAGLAAAELLDAASRVGAECPELTVTELIGPRDTTNEAIAIDGWVGYRRHDLSSGVVTWILAASRDNLLSVLEIESEDGSTFGIEQLADYVELADEALRNATTGAEAPRFDIATTTTTATSGAIAVTTTTTMPAVATTGAAPSLGALDRYLLDKGDLGRPVELDDVSVSADEFEGCDNAEAFANALGQVRVRVETVSDDRWRPGQFVGQALGPLEKPEDSAIAIREIEELARCSLESELIVLMGVEQLDEHPASVVDAAVARFEEDAEEVEVVLVQLDDAFMILLLGEDSGFTPGDMLELIATKAVE